MRRVRRLVAAATSGHGVQASAAPPGARPDSLSRRWPPRRAAVLSNAAVSSNASALTQFNSRQRSSNAASQARNACTSSEDSDARASRGMSYSRSMRRRAARRQRRAARIEKIARRIRAFDGAAPQLAFFDIAQHARRISADELPQAMLFAQPTRRNRAPSEWPRCRGRPRAARAQSVEQRGGQFGIRRQYRLARRIRGQQAGRDALRAQRCWTFAADPTIFNSGPSAAWASSSSSMRANTVLRTSGSGRLVMRKALR